jgi:formylglycine-generating enzyme required for sulfatase activity
MASTVRKISLVSVFIFLLLVIQILMPDRGLCAEKGFTNSIGMEFVLIPAGTFMMGSPPDEPHRQKSETQHQVTITKPFYMQTTEVTVEQWRSLMGKKFFGLFRRKKEKESKPIVKVSWFDCVDFVKKLNDLNEGVYRLPTEAEWEYACRAGSSDAYSWGKDIDCTKAMYSNNPPKSEDCTKHNKSRGLPSKGPAVVKSYPPNVWGLYDMHGNVWEWCQDWFGDYSSTAVVDPKGPETGTKRVRRGGSWFKYGWSCRSANRNNAHPATKHNTLGFRVVREVQ